LAKVNSSTFVAGDVVALDRGETFTGSAKVSNSGTSTNPITFTAYGSGSQPILTNPGGWFMLQLDGAYQVVNNLKFYDGAVFDNSDGLGISGAKYVQSGAVDITDNATNATVKNSVFSNVGIGVKAYGASPTITHNTFQDLQIAYNGTDSGSPASYGAVGVSLDNSGGKVSYNDFINCRSTNSPYGADGGAVEIEGFTHTKDNISIDHNYSRGTQGFLEVTETSSANVSVVENVSDDNQQFIAFDTTTTPSGYVAANNTIVRRNNSFTGYLFDIYYYRVTGPTPQDSWLTVRNNVFETPYQVAFGTYNWPHDHNLYYGGTNPAGVALGVSDIISDPRFVNYSTGDLRLTVQSPAVDNGTTAGASTDLDGHSTGVGLGVDIGAFEYQTANAGGSSITSNSGFESGQTTITSSTSPWYTDGSLSYGVDVNAGKSHSGLNNGWIATSSSSWGAVKQTINVSPSSTYRMTVWVRNSGNFSGAYLGAKSTTGSVLNEVNHGQAGGYQRFIVTFDTGSNATVVLHIGFWGPGASAWEQIDDVTLQKL